MIRSIGQYFDQAKQAQGLVSDAALARRLGIAGPSLSQMRNGKIFPAEKTLVRTAEMARLDVELALIDLNYWRTKDEASRSVYAKLRHTLKRTAASLLCAGFIGFGALSSLDNAQAATLVNVGHPPASEFILWKVFIFIHALFGL